MSPCIIFHLAHFLSPFCHKTLGQIGAESRTAEINVSLTKLRDLMEHLVVAGVPLDCREGGAHGVDDEGMDAMASVPLELVLWRAGGDSIMFSAPQW